MALRSARMSKRSTGGAAAPSEKGAPDGGRRSDARKRLVPVVAGLPATTGWLLRGKDDRLTAYAPAADGVLWWTETTPGGPRWSAPAHLSCGGTVRHLSIAQSAEGYVHLVVLRERPSADGSKTLTDVMYAIQYQSGRPLRDWQTLGNPYKDPAKQGRLGLLSTLIDEKGGLHVYTRNAEGRVSVKRQTPKGSFEAWETISVEGTPVTGEVSATLVDAVAVDLLAPTDRGLLHWQRAVREEPDEEALAAAAAAAAVSGAGASGAGAAEEEEEEEEQFEPVEDGAGITGIAPGTMVAEHTAPGRLTRFWRDAATTRLRAWRSGGAPVDIGGLGTGPVASLRTPVDGMDCTILAQRGADGRAALAAYPTEEESTGLTWVASGEPLGGAPALALDGLGRVVLAAVGQDGVLRVTRQKPEEGLALESWTPVDAQD